MESNGLLQRSDTRASELGSLSCFVWLWDVASGLERKASRYFSSVMGRSVSDPRPFRYRVPFTDFVSSAAVSAPDVSTRDSIWSNLTSCCAQAPLTSAKLSPAQAPRHSSPTRPHQIGPAQPGGLTNAEVQVGHSSSFIHSLGSVSIPIVLRPPAFVTNPPVSTSANMSSDLGKSRHGIPDVIFEKIDKYVDSLAPEIQPRIASELETFQSKTIDSLEDQVVDAFRSLFNKDKDPSGARSLNDSPPDAYGNQSLPFADEIAKLTRSFSKITDEAGDDLRDIFDLTEGRGGGGGEPQSRGIEHTDSFSRGAKGFLSAAINAVQDHIGDDKQGGSKFELDGLLGVLSNTVKDAARNPEEKARVISPEIKDMVGAKLREQHAPIAEQFTRLALDHIKRWLRGNTSARDVGDGVKGEVEDQVKDLVKGLGGLFGKKSSSDEGASRGFGDRDGEDGGGSGFSKVISDKLSTGLAKVHREVRLEFRNILGSIEKQLFELLPDQFQRPLEKILGGNPFDSQLDREAGGSTDRGFGDDVKLKLVNKIRGLIRKVQETLRESILGVVNGGHRKFERESWVFVQNMVEVKVQKYLPKVKISVPDDIGNEGVSVGNPDAQFGGGQQSAPQGNYPPPPSQHESGGHQQSYSPSNYQQQQHHQEYRPDQYQRQQHQEHRPDQNQQYQGHSYEQYNPGQHQQYGQNQSYGGNQGYGGGEGYGNQDYDNGHGHGQNPDYGQNPRY
ncbi:hypothetical protein CTRI78_v007672 [Colletotrichum trifolii]|uniref:C6 zinc finger domain-containing protein n=1 Tax=Colletotrichum trifolii TaxID=5466 RepID=A0A4R8R1D3_COLTR|nr:hypothetical protein CTRI78_v007672 [Colletotrichum trifolii]